MFGLGAFLFFHPSHSPLSQLFSVSSFPELTPDALSDLNVTLSQHTKGSNTVHCKEPSLQQLAWATSIVHVMRGLADAKACSLPRALRVYVHA